MLAFAPRSQQRKITINSLADGRCRCSFTVRPEQLNAHGVMHGGFITSVCDTYMQFALFSKPKPFGVSVSLKMSFLRPAKLGDQVVVDANLVRCGQRLAYIECELRHAGDGDGDPAKEKVIARSQQTVALTEDTPEKMMAEKIRK